LGGTLAAIERGYIQNEIQNAAYDYQRGIETGEIVIVGVNRYRQDDGAKIPTFKVDPELERHQVERLRELRASRSAADVAARRGSLEATAKGTENLMPHILACCAAKVTVGEISDTLRGVFGEYRESGV
jgi:methylmalonyl-CoA mutase N-terminal domain/subunit